MAPTQTAKPPKITPPNPSLGSEPDFSSSGVGTWATSGGNPNSGLAVVGKSLVGPPAGVAELHGMLSAGASALAGTSATSGENAGAVTGETTGVGGKDTAGATAGETWATVDGGRDEGAIVGECDGALARA
uniref:Uncharacterized protein n=1 Tax=Opuntia streptacantha TaxID=393608 RepID=A0A7C9CV95_OPUST